MEYIDKHDVLRINAFNALVDTFIAQGIFHYKDLDNGQRNQIRDILRFEQNFFCAYCMQKDVVGSVEHVVAQHISRQDFGRAIHRGVFFHSLYIKEPLFIHPSRFCIILTLWHMVIWYILAKVAIVKEIGILYILIFLTTQQMSLIKKMGKPIFLRMLYLLR